MGLVRSLWNGDIPLGRAWWLYGFLIGFLLQLPLITINAYPIRVETIPMRFLVLLLAVLIVVYAIFMTVAIWRSATKYAGPKWLAILAKGMLIIGWARGIVDMIGPVPSSAP
jgi:hypothetical protein